MIRAGGVNRIVIEIYHVQQDRLTCEQPRLGYRKYCRPVKENAVARLGMNKY